MSTCIFVLSLLAATALHADPLCHLPGASCDAPLLGLPIQGVDVCQALRAGCGRGEPGALCLKAQLTALLHNRSLLERVRVAMVVPDEFYFLCAGPTALRVNRSARVRTLGDQLRATRGDDNAAMQEYSLAASQNELSSWSAAERQAHYLDMLRIFPRSVHAISCLAIALAERFAPRAMLLHYAVLDGLIERPHQRPAHLVRGLAATPFWKPTDAHFPWLASLLRPHNVDAMRREALRVAWRGRGALGTEQEEGLHSGSWREVHLVQSGERSRSAEEAAPLTARLLRLSGAEIINARLSILRPGTHILPHCGLTNAKLRVHIPLLVGGAPSPSLRSGLRVGGMHSAVRQWVEGEAIAFDDSFEHEVWWRCPAAASEVRAEGSAAATAAATEAEAMDHDRIVLIVDVFHPQLSAAERTRMRAHIGGVNPGGSS